MVDGIRDKQPVEYAPPPAIAAKEGEAQGKLTSIGKAFGHFISQLGDKIKNSAPIQQISLLYQAIMLKPEGEEKIPRSLQDRMQFVKEKQAKEITKKEINFYLSKGCYVHENKIYQPGDLLMFRKDGELFIKKENRLIATIKDDGRLEKNNGLLEEIDDLEVPEVGDAELEKFEELVAVVKPEKEVEKDDEVELTTPVMGDFLENLDEFGKAIPETKDDAATRKAKRQSKGEDWGDYSKLSDEIEKSRLGSHIGPKGLGK